MRYSLPLLLALAIGAAPALPAQSYTAIRTGNSADTAVLASGGICLMGGAAEDDQAMRWFLERAGGGDVLVFRTTGSDGYNAYFYEELDVALNSVETIVCHDAAASNHPYVLQRIGEAEAIWFTGGDQWSYLSFWRNTAFDEAVNRAIRERNIAIGGTSAGMAIQGQFYFSAENGTINSASALANPFDPRLTVDSAAFLGNSWLRQTLTDTHFDNPDRKGRLAAFLARIYTDYGIAAQAIACDEYTAVCIDTSGIARVFGGHPAYEDYAYFIQTNCELPSQAPELCSPSNPLTWNLDGQALAVYQIPGESSGSRFFDLRDWQSGSGGTWLRWSVAEGALTEQEAEALNCGLSGLNNFIPEISLSIHPNPTFGRLVLSFHSGSSAFLSCSVYNTLGTLFPIEVQWLSPFTAEIDLASLDSGLYFIHIIYDRSKRVVQPFIKW
jgi:cyanophycinase-like exopeptidase